MERLSNTQIDNLCKKVVYFYENSDIELYEFFNILYITGVRASELLQLNRWFVFDEYRIGLIGLKGAKVRLFDKSLFSDLFLSAVIDKVSLFNHLSYSTVKRYFVKALNVSVFYPSLKRIQLHLFRHNYIRKLSDRNVEFEQIILDLGKMKFSDISTYLYTDLLIKDKIL